MRRYDFQDGQEITQDLSEYKFRTCSTAGQRPTSASGLMGRVSNAYSLKLGSFRDSGKRAQYFSRNMS